MTPTKELSHESKHTIAAGIRLRLRDEDFIVTRVERDIIEAEGIS